MLLVPVVSSDIAAMGYDPATFEMQIQFQTGRVYSYQSFPLSLYQAFIGAPSKGKFFAQFIKKIYPATRLDAATPAPITGLPSTNQGTVAGDALSVLENIERYEGLL